LGALTPAPAFRADIVIVGAGAAGLATGIFARRANPTRSVLLLDGARQPGAKILVSGGGRCNVTNREVSERDFSGGRRSIIRRILRAFPADAAVEFFREVSVTLREEADGKLFPSSGRARDVLNALLRGAEAVDVHLLAGHRVLRIERSHGRFHVITAGGVIAGDVPSFRIDNMPYGGIKESGLGREGLRYAIEDMTEPRLLVMNLR